jgi:hypothetical protein
MRRQRLAASGFTVLEMLISAVVLVVVLAATAGLVEASRGLSQTSSDAVVASTRVDRALAPMADALRRGSLASVRRTDGANFGSGSADVGFSVRGIEAWSGRPVESAPVTYRFDLPAFATEGEIVRVKDGVEEVLARGVTSFSVSRTGNVFELSIATTSGADAERAGKSAGVIRVSARNP